MGSPFLVLGDSGTMPAQKRPNKPVYPIGRGVGPARLDGCGERGRQGRQASVYAFGGRLRPSSYTWVKETYRSRFAMETSYRQMHQARIRTCTRDPLLRLLYVGVALLLRNVWVWLHWEILSHSRRGGRRIDLGPLSMRKLLVWLQHLVEETYGIRDELLAEHPLPLGLTLGDPSWPN